jgi:hypothetical protein
VVTKTDTDQDPEVSPHNYNQLIFDKRAKNVHCRKNRLTNGVGKTGYPHAEA